ncbi:hypothetical protein [Hyunsoonleella pacifica]|uniref:Uncharacterized protein n=1 Tax=Hyunsoonleella pacifica TaxID=1080224 RepID=A0A4Q9FQ39_9FLAO|nr:hypothetical protein [Hyunsoonleella pacifica]TBN17605.1 hypothetical protein EYD46_04630 [Hyunsoonleella pacifica]GGD10477.1 hypothetical protein GCM10011368_10590 [Hyunsoonleella pacifica]
MGLDLVIFIAAILLGVFVYWRESQRNTLYRFFNKIFNSKELQMKPENKKGFIYKQTFLPRMVYVVGFLLLIGLIIQFLSPISIFTSYYGISAFASISVGILIGTYVANFVLKSGKIIEEKGDSLEGMVQDTIEKGKDLIEDLKTKEAEELIEHPEEASQKETKSARDRLKDKGYLK